MSHLRLVGSAEEPAEDLNSTQRAYLDSLHAALAPFFARTGDGAGDYSLPVVVPEVVPGELVEKIAALSGDDLMDVMDSDYIDMLARIATNAVVTEAAKLRRWAMEQDRKDLLTPYWELVDDDPA